VSAPRCDAPREFHNWRRVESFALPEWVCLQCKVHRVELPRKAGRSAAWKALVGYVPIYRNFAYCRAEALEWPGGRGWA
jgi:hypothetical protein